MDNELKVTELCEKELETVSGGVDANRGRTVEEVIERINSGEYRDVPGNIRKQITEALREGGCKKAYELGMAITKRGTPARRMVESEIPWY